MTLKIGDKVKLNLDSNVKYAKSYPAGAWQNGRWANHGTGVIANISGILYYVRFDKATFIDSNTANLPCFEERYLESLVSNVVFTSPKELTFMSVPHTHDCTCGAFVTYGAGKKSSLHSDWCNWK